MGLNGDCAEIVQNGAVAEKKLPISLRVWALWFIRRRFQVVLRRLEPSCVLGDCFFARVFSENRTFFRGA